MNAELLDELRELELSARDALPEERAALVAGLFQPRAADALARKLRAFVCD